MSRCTSGSGGRGPQGRGAYALVGVCCRQGTVRRGEYELRLGPHPVPGPDSKTFLFTVCCYSMSWYHVCASNIGLSCASDPSHANHSRVHYSRTFKTYRQGKLYTSIKQAISYWICYKSLAPPIHPLLPAAHIGFGSRSAGNLGPWQHHLSSSPSSR